MNHKTLKEKISAWIASVEKRQADGTPLTAMTAEIDAMEHVLKAADCVSVRGANIPRDEAGFNQWTRSSIYTDGIDSPIGREDVSYVSGERVVSVGENNNRGGTRYCDLRGNEVRIFNRGESYAEHLGADRNWSLGKALRGIITGRWDDADKEKRLMTVVNDSAGGFLLTPEMSAQVIDLARNKSSVFAAGVKYVPMQTNELVLAKLNSDPTSQWVSENGGVTASDASFGQTILRAKTLACLAGVSIPLLEDAANAPAVIENAVLQSIANEWDRAVLRGAANSNGPLGIANITGINTITSVGTPTFDDVIDGMGDIDAANGAATAWILNSRDNETFRHMKDGNGMWLTPPPDVGALTKVISNQIPRTLGGGTESEIYVGDFTKCVVGVRTTARLEVFRSGGTASEDAVSGMRVFVRCYLRTDSVLEQPGHFCLLSGVTA